MVSQIVWSTISSSERNQIAHPCEVIFYVIGFVQILCSCIACWKKDRLQHLHISYTYFHSFNTSVRLFMLMNSPMKWSIRFYAFSLELFVLRWSSYKTELRQVMFSLVCCCRFYKDWASLNTIHSSPSVLCKPKHCVLQIMSIIRKSVVVLWESMREVSLVKKA